MEKEIFSGCRSEDANDDDGNYDNDEDKDEDGSNDKDEDEDEDGNDGNENDDSDHNSKRQWIQYSPFIHSSFLRILACSF